MKKNQNQSSNICPGCIDMDTQSRIITLYDKAFYLQSLIKNATRVNLTRLSLVTGFPYIELPSSKKFLILEQVIPLIYQTLHTHSWALQSIHISINPYINQVSLIYTNQADKDANCYTLRPSKILNTLHANGSLLNL